ncbi:hypothetical protein D3C78_1935030 [compost metagenome]
MCRQKGAVRLTADMVHLKRSDHSAKIIRVQSLCALGINFCQFGMKGISTMLLRKF